MCKFLTLRAVLFAEVEVPTGEMGRGSAAEATTATTGGGTQRETDDATTTATATGRGIETETGGGGPEIETAGRGDGTAPGPDEGSALNCTLSNCDRLKIMLKILFPHANVPVTALSCMSFLCNPVLSHCLPSST